MLIRVDIFPHDFQVNSNHSTTTNEPSNNDPTTTTSPLPISSPVPPLFVCLGTCNENGRLLSIGRKDAHVCFSKDKSVSRQHLEVVLMSSSTTVKDGIEHKTAKPAHPSTPAERKACKNNPMHMCLVAKDLGSKFGTYLVVVEEQVEEQDDDEDTKKKDDASSLGDDETDDEGAAHTVPHSQTETTVGGGSGTPLPPLSAVTSHLVRHNKCTATLRKMEPSEEVLLPDLLLQDDNTNRIILQCGQHGATVVLTHVPFTLAWSTVDASTRELWNKRLVWMGASCLDQSSHAALDSSLTHLIANERKPNAKQLCAWVLQRPIVTTQYLQVLWDRQTPTDAMPMSTNIKDYAPTDPQKSSFWHHTTPSPTLLSDCTLLSVTKDDMECLCRAAGCDVVSLHAVRTEKQFASKLTQLKKKKEAHYFYMALSKPPSKKVEKRLQKLKESDIAVATNSKLIAKSVAYQEQLKDVQGKFVVGGGSEDDEECKTPAAAAPNSEDPAPSEGLVSEREEEEEEELVPVAPSAAASEPLEAIPEERHSEVQAEETSAEKEEASTITEEANDSSLVNPPPDVSVVAPSQSTETSGWISTKKRTRDADNSMSTSLDELQAQQQSHEETAAPLSQRRRLTYSQDQDDDDDEMQVHDDEEEEDEESQQPHGAHKKSKLPTSSDGWMMAAPKGAARMTYRTSDRELREYWDGEVPAVAPTDRVSNLVVDVTNQQKKRSSKKTSKSRSKRGAAGTKDFKKFRKNLVFKVSAEDRVILNVVTPKETQKQRELEKEHRRLEEEERIADSLFGDPDKVPKKKGRRRS